MLALRHTVLGSEEPSFEPRSPSLQTSQRRDSERPGLSSLRRLARGRGGLSPGGAGPEEVQVPHPVQGSVPGVSSSKHRGGSSEVFVVWSVQAAATTPHSWVGGSYRAETYRSRFWRRQVGDEGASSATRAAAPSLCSHRGRGRELTGVAHFYKSTLIRALLRFGKGVPSKAPPTDNHHFGG